MNIDERISMLEQSIKHIQASRNNKLYKVLLLLFGCFWAAVIVAYNMYLYGSTYFLLLANIISPQWQLDLTCFIITNIEYGLMFAAILGKFDKRTFTLSGIYCLISIIMAKLFPYSLIQTIIAPSIYIFLYVIYISIKNNNKKNILLCIVRYFIFNIIIVLYQLLIAPIKLQLDSFVLFKTLNALQSILINLDVIMIIFLIAILLINWEVKNYGWMGQFHLVDTDTESNVTSHDDETLALLQEFNSLSLWKRIRGVMIMIAIQIIQTLLIALVCSFNNRLIELCIIAPVFFLVRMIFKKSYHSDSIFICTALSCLIFYCVTALSIPFKYSMFSPIIWAGLLGYGMYLAAIHFDEHKELQAYKKQHEAFNILTCTEEELRRRCKERKINPDHIEIAVCLFVKGYKPKELTGAPYYCSESNAKAIKSRIIKKLK